MKRNLFCLAIFVLLTQNLTLSFSLDNFEVHQDIYQLFESQLTPKNFSVDSELIRTRYTHACVEFLGIDPKTETEILNGLEPSIKKQAMENLCQEVLEGDLPVLDRVLADKMIFVPVEVFLSEKVEDLKEETREKQIQQVRSSLVRRLEEMIPICRSKSKACQPTHLSIRSRIFLENYAHIHHIASKKLNYEISMIKLQTALADI